MIYVVIATTKGRRERLQKCINAIRESTMPHALVVYENSDGGCVLATKKAIEGINGEIFLLNDDMIIAPDCLEILAKTYRTLYPNQDGVCQPDDNYHRGIMAVSPYCHTNTIRPFLEDYIHNGWDGEFSEVMKLKGKYTTVLEAKMDHQHFTKGVSQFDATYALSVATQTRDNALLEKRLADKFSHRFK